MITLREERVAFSNCLCALVLWVNSQSTKERKVEVALGRDYDEANEKLRHMKSSTHYLGLGNDLVLYIDGVYQKKTEDYKFIGDKWKQMHPDARWGGDFKSADGNHFSFIWKGVA
jgi:hypothetical protein